MKRSSSKSMAAAASPPLGGGWGDEQVFVLVAEGGATCQGSAASAMALVDAVG